MAYYGSIDMVKTSSGISYEDLGLANEAAYTAYLETLMTQATDDVNRYCHRDFFLHEGNVDYLDGNDTNEIQTTGWPIITITELKEGDNVLDPSYYRIKRSNPYEGNAGIIEKKNALWREEWNNIEITYDWGYSVPPDAIEGVVEGMVAQKVRYDASAYQGKGVKSISMEGFSVSFTTPDGKPIIDQFSGTLNAFRITVFA